MDDPLTSCTPKLPELGGTVAVGGADRQITEPEHHPPPVERMASNRPHGNRQPIGIRVAVPQNPIDPEPGKALHHGGRHDVPTVDHSPDSRLYQHCGRSVDARHIVVAVRHHRDHPIFLRRDHRAGQPHRHRTGFHIRGSMGAMADALVTFDAGRFDDFYRRLRRRITTWLESDDGRRHRWADVVCLAPDLVHLMVRLMLDVRVPPAAKSQLMAALLYFVSPLDALPEAILGPAGYLDDIALAAFVLDGLLNRVDPEVLRHHWAGRDDVLDVIRRLVASADDMIGSGLWHRLRRRLTGRPR